ncbi:hypothetical protein [Endozoicomonas sp. Mp262]|uniref:hypothetical protein n=1 Tax=Endozoicomonas sp. Mp262 TaxID=2919499 RepID=UPI0021D9146F
MFWDKKLLLAVLFSMNILPATAQPYGVTGTDNNPQQTVEGSRVQSIKGVKRKIPPGSDSPGVEPKSMRLSSETTLCKPLSGDNRYIPSTSTDTMTGNSSCSIGKNVISTVFSAISMSCRWGLENIVNTIRKVRVVTTAIPPPSQKRVVMLEDIGGYSAETTGASELELSRFKMPSTETFLKESDIDKHMFAAIPVTSIKSLQQQGLQ